MVTMTVPVQKPFQMAENVDNSVAPSDVGPFRVAI